MAINKRLSQSAIYDINNKLLPDNIKEALMILAYMNNYVYRQYDKNLYESIKNNAKVLNKYGVYYALKKDIDIKILSFLKTKLFKQIKDLLPLNIQIKDLSIQTAEDYEINNLIHLLNYILKNFTIKDINSTQILVDNFTDLKLSAFNNTLKLRQDCNIYTVSEKKRFCKLLNTNFFKDFDLYSGLQEDINNIVQGLVDEINEVNTYTSDKQFNAKIDEIQIDYSIIDSTR